MAEPLQNLSFDQLKNLLKRSYLQEPLGKIGEQAYRKTGGEVSPYQTIAGRSSVLDYLRQLLVFLFDILLLKSLLFFENISLRIHRL